MLVLLLAAWRPPRTIIWLNLLAFGGMEAVFLWLLVLGLYWELANAVGALSSIITGGTSYTLLAGFNLQPGSFHSIVLALVLSLLAFLASNRCGRPSRYAPDATENHHHRPTWPIPEATR
ncbi:MAG: Sodium/pantothenate symporter [Sodalis sp.]|nr:MAG: Sodium/pantothenate symporter [Sodalis sp.]